MPDGMVPGGTFVAAPPASAPESELTRGRQEDNSHLRSTGELTGYFVETTDGSIGCIKEFVVDETEWAVHYLMIDTKNWWSGKIVLISPSWLRDIVRSDEKIFVDVTRD